MSDGVFKDPNSSEWFFPSDMYILSETDAKGVILYANDLFCEIADYTKEELVGKAHSIVRHSDMPRVAFKSLWRDIQTKGFWSGMVKNLRKDGGFYWVYATVLRRTAKNGEVTYLSIRRSPSRSDVKKASELYAKLQSSE